MAAVTGGEIAGESDASRRQRFAECLRRAGEALEQGKLTAVRGYLQKANVLADASGRTRIAAIQQKLVAAGQEQFALAEQLSADGEHLEALEIFRIIEAALPATPTGKAARRKLQLAERNPEIRSALHEVRAAALLTLVADRVAQSQSDADAWNTKTGAKNPEAAPEPVKADGAELLTAIGTLEAADLDAAIRTLTTIATRYSDCETGQRAADLRKKLNADKAVADKLAAHRASAAVRRQLKLAMTYEKTKRYQQAAAIYSKIVANYPESPWASQATDRLKAIEGKYLSASSF